MRQFKRPREFFVRLLVAFKEVTGEPVVLIKEIRNRLPLGIKIDRTIRNRADHEEFEERRRQKITHFFRGSAEPLACAHFLPADVEELVGNIKGIREMEYLFADSRADLPRTTSRGVIFAGSRDV